MAPLALAAFIWYYAWQSNFGRYILSTIEIRDNDDVYNYVMYWMSLQPSAQKIRCLVAGTKTSHSVFLEGDPTTPSNGNTELELFREEGFEDYLRLANRDKFKPLLYTPSEGSHCLWYRGKLTIFTRVRGDNPQSLHPATKRIYISCLGFSPKTLKSMVKEAQLTYLERDGSCIAIYRVQKKSEGDEGWFFIDDVAEYLNPVIRRWYANRGIPYRRGYLFHGLTGTGKTSLCYAVAGFLQLKLYVVSLGSKTLTDESLANLFQSLPHRCIILFEDVDAAGVTSDRGSATTAAPSPFDGPVSATAPPKGISLSSLLNIIDGVASQEGDWPADKSAATPQPTKMGSMTSPKTAATKTFPRLNNPQLATAPFVILQNPIHHHDLLDEEVGRLAEAFAEKVPDGEFTPAEVQGYLLMHKYDSRRAAEKAQTWVLRLREEKEERERKKGKAGGAATPVTSDAVAADSPGIPATPPMLPKECGGDREMTANENFDGAEREEEEEVPEAVGL